MTPQPAERICLIWSGRKNMSVALLGTRSTVEPSACKGLNLFTTWLGVASTRTVWALAGTAFEKITQTEITTSERVIMWRPFGKSAIPHRESYNKPQRSRHRAADCFHGTKVAFEFARPWLP